MSDTDSNGTEHRCKRCQELTEPVTLGGGGRIGWFCYECDLFHPGEAVKTWPLLTGTDHSGGEQDVE